MLTGETVHLNDRQSRRWILLGTGGKSKTGSDTEAQGSRAGTWPQGLEEGRIYQGKGEYAQFWPLLQINRRAQRQGKPLHVYFGCQHTLHSLVFSFPAPFAGRVPRFIV